MTRQDKTRQDKTGPDKTRQDKTKLDKTRHNKARQDITSKTRLIVDTHSFSQSVDTTKQGKTIHKG
jgi:hypothetical protein